MIQAVIFDMDGVIIDSEYSYIKAKNEILQSAGYLINDDYHYDLNGLNPIDEWKAITQDYPIDKPLEDLITEMFERRQNIVDREGIVPIEGAIALIKSFKSKGLKLAIASTSPKKEIQYEMNYLGLVSSFEIMVSGEVPRHKPVPDIYLYTAELLEVSPKECIAIEDSMYGVESASRAGMFVYGFANPAYPDHGFQHANKVIHNFNQINLEKDI